MIEQDLPFRFLTMYDYKGRLIEIFHYEAVGIFDIYVDKQRIDTITDINKMAIQNCSRIGEVWQYQIQLQVLQYSYYSQY